MTTPTTRQIASLVNDALDAIAARETAEQNARADAVAGYPRGKDAARRVADTRRLEQDARDALETAVTRASRAKHGHKLRVRSVDPVAGTVTVDYPRPDETIKATVDIREFLEDEHGGVEAFEADAAKNAAYPDTERAAGGRYIVPDGRRLDTYRIAKEYGLDQRRLRRRLEHGWPLHRALGMAPSSGGELADIDEA